MKATQKLPKFVGLLRANNQAFTLNPFDVKPPIPIDNVVPGVKIPPGTITRKWRGFYVYVSNLGPGDNTPTGYWKKTVPNANLINLGIQPHHVKYNSE